MTSNDTWLGKALTDRKTQILCAAQNLFAASSFRNTEVSDIANAASVSKATIYKHFASKDEILLKVVEENFQFIRDMVILRLLTGSETPLERLKAAAIDVARHLEQNKSFVHVLIKDAGECMPEIQKIHHAIMHSNSTVAEGLFKSLSKDGSIPETRSSDLLKIVSDICIGATYSWVLGDKGSLVDSVEFYFKFLFQEYRC
ncbi:TetR/AcrR family transcriptional regulator [Ketobacter sp.]|uniref:TetR/AcrR family transcriptional regulator n=1 Tax=Ketobacter sp. TaxID=2083498 RepID=UPI000F168DDF|nr:TetR/AcrR family transcriptional regulator [Ketobacter sp.]RLT95090.1 MAG: TetR/AcrR family transcriptional regulator [Ketobacter sp.]